MTPLDLMPAATTLGWLVQQVPDERLGDPTPCPEYAVGDLLDHIGGLALAFTATAGKIDGPLTSSAPDPAATRLPADWRTRIPADLVALGAAWRDPAAWTGMSKAGGVSMPGEVTALVALDEIVVHGWDLAVAIGRPYEVEPDLLPPLHAFVSSFGADPATRGTIFGPIIAVPPTASALDQVLGLTGRDPGWSAPRR
jgi:uncharacterized protein (TIGR03086 family)